MKRHAHRLKRTAHTERPRHFLFFDTETVEGATVDNEVVHHLRLGVACLHDFRTDNPDRPERYVSFRTAEELWNLIVASVQKRSRLFVVAHNISFDLKVVGGFKPLTDRGWKAGKMILNGTTNIWSFKKDTSTIVLLDNMNFFKTSLRSLGESIGIDKLEMPEFGDNDDDWIAYCKRDVEVMVKTMKYWIEFLDVNDLGSFGKTLASQAFNTFRHRFMLNDIFIHTNESVTELERRAYHGGRTECFRIGKQPKGEYYNLDVNSMYPSVMRSNEYPTKFIGKLTRVDIPYLKTLLDKFCVIAEVELSTKQPAYAGIINNRLVFPTGTFTTVLTTRELIHAVHHNHVVKCNVAALYEKAIIFDKYVDFFYTKRQEYKSKGQTAFSYLCKLLLNTLYGKLGQRNQEWRFDHECPNAPDEIRTEYDVQAKRVRTYRIIAGRCDELCGQIEAFHSFPAIPAHITADARLLLYEYIQAVGKDHIYYCDTDSVFTDSVGHARLARFIDPTRLGYLSVKSLSDTLTIRGLKDYQFGNESLIKGVRRDAEQLDDHTFRQIQFEGMNGALRNQRSHLQTTRMITKHIQRAYSKGVIEAGGRVAPFVIDTGTV